MPSDRTSVDVRSQAKSIQAEQKVPRVSIGLPVYNGENYLTEALDSILSQSFEDFELVISDNASTDRTQEICREYVTKDPRIRYYRNGQNLGAAFNFNRVFELSRGEYFKWAAHDDVLAPDFLLKCVEALDRDQSMVLCSSRTRLINEESVVLDAQVPEFKALSSPNPKDRFAEVVLVHHAYEIWGLIRSSVLKKTSLIESFYGSDRTLLALICLYGRFHRVPQYLFYLRDHPERSVKRAQCLRQCWINPANREKLLWWRRSYFFAYLWSITRADLTWREKTVCYVVLIKWFKHYWRHMGGEYKIFLKHKLGLKRAL